MVHHCDIWSTLCLHPVPTESSTRKGVNFNIYHRLRMVWLFFNPRSFTYAFYFVIAFVFEVLYLAITLLFVLLSVCC
jgi:hypothetical protein